MVLRIGVGVGKLTENGISFVLIAFQFLHENSYRSNVHFEIVLLTALSENFIRYRIYISEI